MKNSSLLLLCLFSFSFLSAQENESVNLLTTGEGWTKEIFPFPIAFASEIKYEGVEEAQFLPGWAKQDSPEFWSYVFAWKIKRDTEISAEELEKNIEIYFDGLMGVVNKDTSLQVPATNALFIQNKDASTTGKSRIGKVVVGKVKLYDAFHTQKVFTLHAQVVEHYCFEKEQAIILFKFSPQPFDANVWQKLEQAQLRSSVCDL